MSYPIRRILPGGLYETTSRTIHSRLLLRPSHELNTIINGIVGRGVRMYGVQVVYFVVLSNHVHMVLIGPDDGRIDDFMGFVNGNLAKEAGRLHGWREKFWGRRYRLIPITDEPEAQIARLRYLLAHGCKEGLVRKPSDWPGASGLKALLEGIPIVGFWFNRTAAYLAKRRGKKVRAWDHAEEESFELAPLPCWAHLSAEERQQKVREMVDEIEAETRERHSTQGTNPMGAARVMKQNPHDKPATTKRSPAPLVHAASLGAWISFKEEWRYFVECYRLASRRLQSGDLTVLFPEGAIPPPLPRCRTRGHPDSMPA